MPRTPKRDATSAAPDAGTPGKRGRKSAAEELDLLAKRPMLRYRLPNLGQAQTEDDVIKYLGALNDTYLEGLLSRADLKELRELAEAVRKTVGQRFQRHELNELLRMEAEYKAEETAARQHEALDRQRLAEPDPDAEEGEADGAE